VLKAEPATFITTSTELEPLVARLAARRRLALDTESASYHRYVDRVYLVQVSSDQETALIDPLEVSDLSPIGALLSDPALEIVLHDADYDLRVLDRDYGFRARQVFDTRLAAQLAGEDGVGLGSLLERHLGVRLDKRHQRADWSRRPIPPEMAAYAADDTRHLLKLREVLVGRLQELERLHWAEEEFRRLEELRWVRNTNDHGEDYLRIRGAKSLPRRQRAILQQLYRWRDRMARAQDRAPFRVVSNTALVELARAAPKRRSGLAQVPGMAESIVRRHGRDLLAAIQAGLRVPDSELPRIERPRRHVPDAGYEARLERLKRLRNGCAETVRLDPGLVCPNGTLQGLAREIPKSTADLDRIAELRRWQREVLGEKNLLAAVQG
jgi:ribonuclease D